MEKKEERKVFEEKVFEENLNEKTEIVLRQTDYSRDLARQLLIDNNLDHLLVIRLFLGVSKKVEPKKSINQEIYKHIREKIKFVPLPDDNSK